MQLTIDVREFENRTADSRGNESGLLLRMTVSVSAAGTETAEWTEEQWIPPDELDGAWSDVRSRIEEKRRRLREVVGSLLVGHILKLDGR